MVDTISQHIDHHCHYLLRGAATTLPPSSACWFQRAHSPPSRLPAIKPGAHVFLGPLNQIHAGLPNIAYAEAAPTDGGDRSYLFALAYG